MKVRVRCQAYGLRASVVLPREAWVMLKVSNDGTEQPFLMGMESHIHRSRSHDDLSLVTCHLLLLRVLGRCVCDLDAEQR